MLLKKKFSRVALIRIAMSLLLAFFALNVVARFYPARTDFWDGFLDGARGMLLGMTIGVMVLSVRSRRAAP